MDFLNKHYEKLILFAVLIVFCIGMVSVLNTVNKTKEVKESDLNIEKKEADFVGSAKDEKSVAEQWQSSNLVWHRGEMRKAYKVQVCYSDLVQFIPLATCPGANENCGKLVPISFFADKKCPECGFVLKERPKRAKYRRNVITPDDSDGDGMPDSYEDKYGLNKRNHLDAQYDKDGDGFSNYYEMTVNTDPSKPRSRQPLWRRLRLYAVERVVLPVSFRALMDNNSDDPKKWDAQFNIQVYNYRTRKMRINSPIYKIGDEIKIEKRTYRLEKIDRRKRAKTQEELAQDKTDKKKGGSDDKFVDESIAYLTEIVSPDSKFAPDKLEMQVGKTAYSSDRRPIFVDDGLLPDLRDKQENRIVLLPGQTFQLGSFATGVERYELVSFDDKSKTAVLYRYKVRPKEKREVDSQGNPMIITSEGSIPEDSRVIPVEVQNTQSQESGFEEN